MSFNDKYKNTSRMVDVVVFKLSFHPFLSVISLNEKKKKDKIQPWHLVKYVHDYQGDCLDRSLMIGFVLSIVWLLFEELLILEQVGMRR